jgi:urea transport system substrate-binding protein
MQTFKKMIVGAGLGIALTGAAHAQDETIKVGVLHSLSGTMAI